MVMALVVVAVRQGSPPTGDGREIAIEEETTVRRGAVPAPEPEPGTTLAGRYESVVFDLDGVIYLNDEAIPAAPAAVKGVRELGVRVAFVTNNAVRPPSAVVERLARLGVKATVEEVLTSAHAVVRLLGGERGLAGVKLLVVGGPGLRQALTDAGAWLLDPAAWREAQVVVGGLDPDLSYGKLRGAVLAIAAGARFVGSNPDASLPTPEGPWPGAGSVLALLSVATGVRPEIAGKPERALFEAVAATLGPGRCLMVGDRADTDLVGARALGWGTALVLTGVTRLATLLDLPVAPDHLLTDAGGLLAPPGPEIRPAPGPGGPAGHGSKGPGGPAGPGTLTLLAHSGAAVVGAITCRCSGDLARLERLEVAPPWRGRLVGTRLLLAAGVDLQAAGVRRISADADTDAARRFLQRLGFAPGPAAGPRALARRLGPAGAGAAAQ
jgi:glycerol-1-phosphatase